MDDIVLQLDRTAQLYGHCRGITDDHGTWTWREVARFSELVVEGLVERGVHPGDRVLSVLPSGREFVAVLFGVLRLGAVLVPANGAASQFELDWLIDDAEPVIVVTDRIGVSGVPVVAPAELLDDRMPISASVRSPLDRDDAIGLLLYTSGSSGRPKGIVCRHRAIAFATSAIAQRLCYTHRDVVWTRLPLSFDYGLYQIFLCAFSGAELVLPAGHAAADELTLLRNSGATVVPVVPTLAQMLARLAARDTRPVAVRLFTNTGAALVGKDAQHLRAGFPTAALVCMYGMSECKRITIAEPDEDLTYPGTVGRALPGTRLWIVDEAGIPLRTGQIGEVVVAGPHVMDGYWRAPEQTAQRFRPGPDDAGPALFTGDKGYLDSAGRLYFVGRDDDLFKRRSWRMCTQELETAMLDVPGVEAAAAVPPGPEGVLTVWAVTRRTPAEVLRELTDRLGAARTPDRCVVVAELPRTANGKIDRAALSATAGKVR
ncbi:class I adenylate-forming enzyme family protein [Nocardia sp. NPDC052566]|uniref:class I adenylate-forming enzyme family protein n=1 Tax=Nocardia sp. NPDC052566 TaxID=3364330 RepID=UPI0037CC3B43